MNRHLIIPVVAVTIAGAAAFAATQSYAQTADTTRTTLVQRIAQRFNLQESDVQTIFDEARKEHQSQMHAQFEARLTTAVENGKLTEEQKQSILAKHQELMAEHDAERESLRNMTPEERRTHHQEERAELEAWAAENGIDLQFFMPMGKMGGRHFKGAYGGPAAVEK